MKKRMICVLCLTTNSKPASNFIDIYTKEDLQLDINTIIHKYFFNIKLKKENTTVEQKQYICRECWNIVKDFHQLYERVAEAYQHHINVQSKSEPTALLSDNNASNDVSLMRSPLKTTTTFNLEHSQNTFDVNSNNVFDSGEIKLEVNELELLPEIKVLDETTCALTSPSLEETSRQNYQNNVKVSTHTNNTDVNDDVLKELQTKETSDISLMDTTTDIINTGCTVESTKCIITRKRGRPRKSSISIVASTKIKKRRFNKEIVSENENGKTKSTDCVPVQTPLKSRYKSEEDIELQNGKDAIAIDSNDSVPFESVTDDNDNGIGYSSLDDQGDMKYAIIHKKVPIKPKKYRKHSKPLVAPKHLTRSDIEARRARRIEYDTVIGKFFGSMRCPKCQLLVRCFSDMRAHFRISHNDDHGYVECCGKRFTTPKILAEHVYVHWNPEHFKCSKCDKSCSDSRQLQRHENSHLPNPPPSKYKKSFHCDKCPKTFSSKASFEYHVFAKHVPKEEFQFHCPECNKKLPTDRKLKEHIKYTHDSQSAVICDKCGKTLKSGYTLKKHAEIEHSDKPKLIPEPQQCVICGTWLRHVAGLKQHMKSMHEDTKAEHRCHICNKVSSTSRALKRHIYHNHECAKKFKCTMCEKAFKRAQDLREHTSVHTGEVLYTCPNCPMTFFSNANMYKHRQRLHRAEWEADRKKPIPPNIMGQAKQGSKLVKLQLSDITTTAASVKKFPIGEEQLPLMTHSSSENRNENIDNYSTNV